MSSAVAVLGSPKISYSESPDVLQRDNEIIKINKQILQKKRAFKMIELLYLADALLLHEFMLLNEFILLYSYY